MTEFIIFLALTAAAAVAVVFVTRTYGAADAREQAARAVKPQIEPRSGADRRVRKDRRQSVRYEPEGKPRRAGSRRRTYEGLLQRSAEIRADRSRDTSRFPPPYPG